MAVELKNNKDSQRIKFHFQRFEFKYQLPLATVEGMIPEFLKYMEFDPYAIKLPDHAYTVASLYYDSVGLGCYYDKIAGVKTRKKLRIRFYDFNFNPETPVFLEIKRKYDTVVVKDRLMLNYQQCCDLLQNNKKVNLQLDEAQKETLNEFLWLKNYNGMIPQVLIVYKRKPLISKVDPNFRVTIDFDIQACPAAWLNDMGEKKPVIPNLAILEVKFNNVLPFWFHRLIQKYNLDQRPFSKYCNSLEMCRPELANTEISQYYQEQLELT